MDFCLKKSFLAALLVTASVSALAETTDARLVGNWQGQRNQEGKCSFSAWKMSRTSDGKFDITFYGDPEKQRILGQEKGRWEVKDGKLSLLTDGVRTPDVYTYTFVDDNSVKLTNVERDPSGDCQADYEFTDHRVSP